MTVRVIGKVDWAANTVDFGKDTPAVNINFGFGERALVGDLAGLGLSVSRVGPDGTRYNQHDGADLNFAGWSFVPYIGADPGKVVFGGEFPIGNTGGTVIVDNQQGYLFHYYHLHTDRLLAASGSPIVPGGFIGFSGGAVGDAGRGASTGAHLHLGILDIAAGRFIDPFGPDVEWIDPDATAVEYTEPAAQGTAVVAGQADLVPQPWRLFYDLLTDTRNNPPAPSAAWDARMEQMQQRLVLIAGMVESR